MLDGEIACVDDSGRSVFNDLLFRRRECLLFVFDLLFLNGEDLRALKLTERKARLKRLLRRKGSPVLCVIQCNLDFIGIGDPLELSQWIHRVKRSAERRNRLHARKDPSALDVMNLLDRRIRSFRMHPVFL